jgi:membrane-associated phospholipid phosphatase
MARRQLLLALAAACLGGAAATYLVALHTAGGAERDLLLYRRASGFGSFPVRLAGQRALRTIDAGTLLAALVLLLGVGLVRRSLARALAAVALVVASVGSVELVKHGLPHLAGALPAGRPATWPSGHTSIAVSVGLALVLAAPPLWRPVAALAGAAYAAGIGLSVVVLGWHYPSDVVGSFFLCGFVACLAALAVPSRAGRPSIDLRGLVLALLVVGGGLAVAAAVAEAHPVAVAEARSSRSVLAVASVLGLLSIALFAAYAPLVAERRRT